MLSIQSSVWGGKIVAADPLSAESEGDQNTAYSSTGLCGSNTRISSPGDTDLAESMSALASLSCLCGEYNASRSMFEKVLTVQQLAHGVGGSGNGKMMTCTVKAVMR